MVTRPSGHVSGLIASLKESGRRVLWLPTIEIHALATTGIIRAKLFRELNIAIFVSPNAVEFGLRDMEASVLGEQIEFAAVGPTTAKTLEAKGLTHIWLPQSHYTSEGLLALPRFGARQVSGQNVAIVRGRGGRELLRDQLSQRGARVRYLEVYERRVPSRESPLRAQLGAAKAVVVITSTEGLKNLFHMQPGADWPWLKKQAFVVVGKRQAEFAASLGITGPVIVAKDARDEGIVEVVSDHDM